MIDVCVCVSVSVLCSFVLLCLRVCLSALCRRWSASAERLPVHEPSGDQSVALHGVNGIDAIAACHVKCRRANHSDVDVDECASRGMVWLQPRAKS